MGVCASSQLARKGGGRMLSNWSTTAKVIHMDGKFQEFSQPITASHVLSLHPNTFLCNSETMYVDTHVPHVPADEELQLGQIYFLMPNSISHKPLSLQDLCALAVKACSALKKTDVKMKRMRFSEGNNTDANKFKGGAAFQLALKQLG